MRFCVCWIAAFFIWVSGIASAAAPTRIFILHSYSQEYAWTKSQHQGFIRTLESDPGINTEVSTEYLDTKRRSYDPAYASNLARHLGLKYKGYMPAAIYVSDDDALLFARDYLTTIFPGSPIFFSGINNYDVWKTLDASRYTGMFELKEVTPNLQWLLGMDPTANDLVFIGDCSGTYKTIESQAREQLLNSHLRATFIAETRLDLAVAKLHGLPGKYVFLTTVGGMTDPSGQVLPLRDIVRSFVADGRIVISMEDGYVMEGVMGGWVTSGHHQGGGAAKLLLAHLHGTPVASLPPQLKSPNAWIFDDRVLRKNGIQLPPDILAQADLINPQPGFYEQNHTWIIGGLQGLAALLFLVVIGSLITLSHKNRELRMAGNRAEAATARAELANNAKSEFLANMSHEIRTPLNAIIGLSEIIDASSSNPNTKELHRTIRSSSDALLAIINGILDFSKIEAGQLQIKPSSFNLQKCGEESLNIVTSLAEAKGLKMNFNWDPTLPVTVVGDMLRLRQVLLNLLMNGVKFTERGSISLSITRRDENGSGRIEFAVADTGIGISPEQHVNLFQSFSQVDSSSTRSHGGTGLGLAISQGLVQMMGGTITLESTPDQGSTFRFSLPLVIGESLQTEDPAEAEHPTPDATLGIRCPLRILVAEDSPINQRVIGLMLKQLGYQSVVVSNGLEAINAVDQATYDLVLMDVQMPVIDGLEAAERICSKHPAGSRPHIIALTANVTVEDRQTCLAAGMDGYLSKPIWMEKLATTLHQVYARIHPN